ncbi:DUF2569 domain-containing protein [Bacillus sp. ISL-40]|uniref:DUF2569 family protein n=1 Tax=unclassified Bacillus (in: firmicutes) TaxID=185979 RepID=UPI001BEA9CCA|nr:MULTISPECIES: DUF2569 family protein [unclassified Bacillus (in: firmicutes)]MBT2701589.1 DUF2569 domain-containing protein [Bacillus sp. ISL-40]MBT2744706.1 DUF2569 domain-containing protein [Bacillus sp. ISL-77]
MEQNQGRPIGGWLIILAFQMISGLCLEIWGLIAIFRYAKDFNFKEEVYNTSTEEANKEFFLNYFPLTLFTIAVIIHIFLIFLFFKKHKEFPRAYTYLNFTLLILVHSLEFSSVLVGNILYYFQYTLICLIWTIIWGLYLYRSERVKETFIQNIERKKYVKITEEEYNLIKKKITSDN